MLANTYLQSETEPAYPADDFVDFVTSYDDGLEVTTLKPEGSRAAPLVLKWPTLQSDEEAMNRVQYDGLLLLSRRKAGTDSIIY